jgi:hypothetical protein
MVSTCAHTENYLTYFGPKHQSKHLAKYLRYFARYLSSKYLRYIAPKYLAKYLRCFARCFAAKDLFENDCPMSTGQITYKLQ